MVDERDLKEENKGIEEESPKQSSGEIEKEARDEEKSVGEDSSFSKVSFGIDDSESSGSRMKAVIIVIVILLVLVGISVGAFFLLGKGVNEKIQKDDVKVEEVVDNTPTPSPTPESTLDKAEITIRVLNGSGVAGRAGEAAGVLEDAGYIDVDTGNADSFDYEETVIQIKTDKDEYIDLIVEDLEGSYTIQENTEELDEDSDFDVVIIVGTE